MNIFDNGIIIPKMVQYRATCGNYKTVLLGTEPKEILTELESVKKYEDFEEWYPLDAEILIKKKFTIKLLEDKI